MQIWIGCIISIVLIVAGFLFSNSKRIFFLQCLWWWILQGLNSGGMDYTLNEAIYNGGGNKYEFISHKIIQMFLKIGIDFMWYRAIFSFFSIIIFAYIVSKYSMHKCIVINLYYFFMLADNVTQVRYFFASIVVLLAFYFLVEKRKTWYYLTIVIATGFHTSCFIYAVIPFIIGKFKSNKRFVVRMYLKIFCIIIAEILGFPMIIAALRKMNLIFIANKFYHYLYEDTYSSWAVALLFVGMYAFLLISIQWIVTHSRYKDTIYFDEAVAQICAASMIVLPFLLYNSNFGRYFRAVLILAFIVISNHFGTGIRRGTVTQFIRDGFVCVCILGGIVINIASGFFAFNLLFNHNYLLQMLC